MEADILNKIYEDLEFLKREVTDIKEHMVDEDTVLTDDDRKALREYEKEEAAGELVPLGAVKQELGI